MDVFLALLMMFNAIIVTLFFVVVMLAKKERDSLLAEAIQCKVDAVSFVNTAHEAVSSTAEQVISLTKRIEELKQTQELMRIRK